MSGWLGSLLGVAGQLGGAYLTSQAANRATQQQVASGDRAIAAQTNAANQALGLQADMYNQNRADLQPWRDAGSSALSALTSQVGQNWGPGSAGYDFQFNEGMRALDSSAASRGMLMSGAQAKAAERFGQGLAATARGEELNRLQAIAGLGQTATAQGTGLAQNYATNAANTTTGLGAALSGIYGQQGTAAANGITATTQPWASAANNIWALGQNGKW